MISSEIGLSQETREESGLTLMELARSKDPLTDLWVGEGASARRLTTGNGHGLNFSLVLSINLVPDTENWEVAVTGVVPRTAFSLGYLDKIMSGRSRESGFGQAVVIIREAEDDKIDLSLKRIGGKKEGGQWVFTMLAGMFSDHPIIGNERIEPGKTE